jgi:hypothetical protein
VKNFRNSLLVCAAVLSVFVLALAIGVNLNIGPKPVQSVAWGPLPPPEDDFATVAWGPLPPPEDDFVVA